MAAFTLTPVRPPLTRILTVTLLTVAAPPSTLSLPSTVTLPPAVLRFALSLLATSVGDKVMVATAVVQLVGTAVEQMR